MPIINTLGLLPGSRERSTTALTYLYFPSRYGFETRDDLAHTFVKHIPQEEGLVGVTGAGPARITSYHAVQDALPIVAAATAVLIALLVGINFLSPWPALLVLCAGGLSYLVDIRLLGWISERTGISIPSEIEPLLVVLLLGISTDYAIFYLSGQRRRLQEGEEPRPAARAVAAQYTPTILVAGLTVAAERPLSSSDGSTSCVRSDPASRSRPSIGVVVSVTFMPRRDRPVRPGALLAELGRARPSGPIGRRDARCASVPPSGRPRGRSPC